MTWRFEAPAGGTSSQAEHAAGLLYALLPSAFGSRVDWSALIPIPATFIDPRLAHRYSDLLLSLATRDGSTLLVYVLLEHQSEPDPWMPLRLHGYVHRIWEHWLREHAGARRLPAVLPVVVHHGESGWTAARSLGELYELDAEARGALCEHLPELRFLLDDLVPVPMELIEQRPMTDLGRLTLLLLRQARISADIVADLQRWMGMLARVLRGPAGRWALGLIVGYIFAVRDTVPEGLPEAFEAGLGRDGREAYMSAAQKLVDQGKTEMLLRLITVRFGAPPAAVEARVRAASAVQVVEWAERLLSAASLGDLFEED